jgi:hypothetical protein
VCSASSRLSGSNHSAIDDEDKRIGFLSWIGAKGSAASLVRIAKDRSHLEGSSGFFEGSLHLVLISLGRMSYNLWLGLFTCLANLYFQELVEG